ncbi:hypothetical protein Esti_005626 [Eimeria stiedai]
MKKTGCSFVRCLPAPCALPSLGVCTPEMGSDQYAKHMAQPISIRRRDPGSRFVHSYSYIESTCRRTNFILRPPNQASETTADGQSLPRHLEATAFLEEALTSQRSTVLMLLFHNQVNCSIDDVKRRREPLLFCASIRPLPTAVDLANPTCTEIGFKREENIKLGSWRREDARTKRPRRTSFGSLPRSTLWLLLVFCVSCVFHTAAASARGNPQLAAVLSTCAESGGDEGHLIMNEDLHFAASSHLAIAHSTPTSASAEPLKLQASAAPRHLEAEREAAREEDAFFELSCGLVLAPPQQQPQPFNETSLSESSELQVEEIFSSKEKEVRQGEADVEQEEEGEALDSDWSEKATGSIQQCTVNDQGACLYGNTCVLNGENGSGASASIDRDAADDLEDAAALAAKHSRQQHGCPPHRRMQQLDVTSLGPVAQYAQYLNTFLPAAQQRQQLQLLQQAMASGALGSGTNIAALKRLQRRAQAAAYANSVSSHPLVQGVVRTALTAVADILGSISVADVVHGAVGGALMTPVAPII